MDTLLLAKIPLFAKLSAAELAELASLLKQKEIPSHEAIFWIGDHGTDFYLIQSGRAAVCYPDEHGHEITIAVLGPGDFFGEISLLDGGQRTATIRAEGAATLLSLSREDFLEFLKRNPTGAIHILTILGLRQREMLEKLRGVKNVNEVMQERTTTWQRVADFIATVSASQWFSVFHVFFFAGWMVVNKMMGEGAPDPFPFNLLTMIVSLEAIFLSIFVLVSQNRAGEKDRVRADLDYQVNLKAHLEVMQLHRKMDRIEHAILKLTGPLETLGTGPASASTQMLGLEPNPTLLHEARVLEAKLLGNIPLFSKLAPNELATLAGLLNPRSFRKDEQIVFIGDPGTEFYIVQAGKVAVIQPDESGKDVVLAELGPSQFFGEISLLDGGPRTATVRASTDVTLMALERDHFVEFLLNHPAAAIHILTILGARQRDLMTKLRGIRNVNDAAATQQTRLQRGLTRMAEIFASERFLLFNLFFFVAWIAVHIRMAITSGRAVDLIDSPPTFFWLGFMITIESIVIAMFVLNSQRRQAERDRVRADMEYQVAVKAHVEVMELHRKVDRLLEAGKGE